MEDDVFAFFPPFLPFSSIFPPHLTQKRSYIHSVWRICMKNLPYLTFTRKGDIYATILWGSERGPDGALIHDATVYSSSY